MTKETESKKVTGDTHSANDGQNKFGQTTSQRNMFLVMALNMTWQLAIVVLIPTVGGVELDKALNTNYVFLFVGLAVALAGSILVMWHTMQVANRLPVPKLTDAQKRAIKKSYEEEDDD